MRVLILDFGIMSLINLLMECLCMTPLTHAVMVMRGFTFHPLLYRVLISCLYLVCLCSMGGSENLSWQYLKSTN